MIAAVAKVQQFYRLSLAYLYKNNPFMLFINTFVVNITELLSQKKKLKIATYRVNHLKYRVYQMEQIMEQGNPYNLASGQKIDKFQ